MSKRRVIYASLHETFFLPGVGTLGVTLPSGTKSIKTEMFWIPGEGLEVLVGGRSAMVSAANVKIVEFAEKAVD